MKYSVTYPPPPPFPPHLCKVYSAGARVPLHVCQFVVHSSISSHLSVSFQGPPKCIFLCWSEGSTTCMSIALVFLVTSPSQSIQGHVKSIILCCSEVSPTCVSIALVFLDTSPSQSIQGLVKSTISAGARFPLHVCRSLWYF